jgi:hypothetical protein
LLLGRPSATDTVGRASWVLYESSSVVLRRSTDVGDTLAAAKFHLSVLAAATESVERLALLARTILLPDGTVWLTDPYVSGELAGLDRRYLRAGVTVLPTSIASLDTATGEIVIPAHDLGDRVPTGRLPVARMLFRTVPSDPIDGMAELRLARLVIQHADTDGKRVLEQITSLAAQPRVSIELKEFAEVREEIASLVNGSTPQ